MTDHLGDGDVAADDWKPERREPTWGHPTTLAIVSIVLSLLVLMGSSLFRGLLYTSAFVDEDTSGVDFTGSEEEDSGPGTAVVLGALLSAAFALLPLGLGLRGLRRLVPDDPAWVGPVLRAAVVLSGVALVLRSVLAVLVITSDGTAFSFLNYALLT